jgi:hypothetical protein
VRVAVLVFGQSASTLGSSPRAGFFRIMPSHRNKKVMAGNRSGHHRQRSQFTR